MIPASRFNLFLPITFVWTLLQHFFHATLAPHVPKAIISPSSSSSSSSSPIAIVTGSNTGIGLATARRLSSYGYTVIIACRDATKGAAAASLIPNAIFIKPLDLSSLQSVREFAKAVLSHHQAIAVLVNNAGMNSFNNAGSTVDGHERTYKVNFLGHFLLTNLLLAHVTRVVNLSSVMHHFGGDLRTASDWTRAATAPNPNAYADAKLAAILLTLEINRRTKGRVRSIAVNPGAVNSDIWRSIVLNHPTLYKFVVGPVFRALYLDTEKGSTCSVAAAVMPWPDSTVVYLQPYKFPSGCTHCVFEMMGVFDGFGPQTPTLPGGDGKESAKMLWESSCKLVGVESS